jgi:hypothetical protein
MQKNPRNPRDPRDPRKLRNKCTGEAFKNEGDFREEIARA